MNQLYKNNSKNLVPNKDKIKQCFYLFELSGHPSITKYLCRWLTTLPSLMILGCLSISGQTSGSETSNLFVPSPPSLKMEGVPQVPLDLASKAGRYTYSRAANLLGWHPTRREILITTRFGETSQVHKVEGPGLDRSQLTFFSDPIQFSSFQPVDGKSLVLLKDENGNERDQLYRLDLDSNSITQLTFDQEPVVNPMWAHSGKWLLYASAKRTGKTTDVYLINPLKAKDEHKIAELDAAYAEVWDVSPDDRKAICYQYISAEETALWLIDIETGKVKMVTPPAGKEKIAYRNAAFSQDGKGLYITSNQGSDFSKPAYLDLATEKITFLPIQNKGDMEAISLSPDGKLMAYTVNEEGIGRLHLYNLEERKEESLPQLPVGIVNNIKWHDPTEFGFNLETARYPSDVYSLNVRSKKLERWTRSETGGINTENFPEAELIHWKSFDNLQLSGFLYKPPANKFSGPRPVLIDIHGGPQLQARPTYGGRYFYYADQMGIAMIFPNVRGSGGFGKTFLSLDNREKRGDSVKDLQALLDYIKKQPELDASQVFIRGDSYGGILALSLAAVESQRIKGVMSLSGITSVIDYVKTADPLAQGLLRVEYGDERDPQQLRFMEAVSPLSSTEKINVPLLLAAGKNDFRVPPSLTEKMVTAERARNLPVWYLLAGDEGHSFRRKVNKDYLFYATILFIEKFATKK